MCIKRLHAVTMRLPISLTLTLFSVFLLIAARDEPVQVIGLINQSVRLSSDFHRMDQVFDVVWRFQSKNETIRIAEFRNSQFNVFTITDQFINRLNQSDSMKGLIIRDLRAEDSGLYERTITLKNKKEARTGYNLAVYDPVPAPEIQTKLQISSSDWCNFTLHCSVPTNAAALSVSWMYRHTDTEYTPFNQTVYNNDRTVHLSLTQQERDMNLLCLVQNPVDQKNVSVSARLICADNKQSAGDRTERHRILLAVLLTITLLILTAAIVIIWKKRKDSRSPRHTGSADVQVDEASSGANDEHFPSDSAERAKSHEIQYLEVNAETFSNRAQSHPFLVAITTRHQTILSNAKIWHLDIWRQRQDFGNGYPRWKSLDSCRYSMDRLFNLNRLVL